MKELSILAFKRIIRQTGARASEGAARELARSIEEIARELAERGKTLAFHSERKTVKEKDIKQAVRELLSR
ncbi:MAG: histone [Candidatus Lokiarchaeia archaeon]